MKKWFRSESVQRFLADVFSLWLRLCFLTMRWTREGQDLPEGVWAAWRTGQAPYYGKGAILCFWHGRIPLSPMSWPQAPERHDMRALISRSLIFFHYVPSGAVPRSNFFCNKK